MGRCLYDSCENGNCTVKHAESFEEFQTFLTPSKQERKFTVSDTKEDYYENCKAFCDQDSTCRAISLHSYDVLGTYTCQFYYDLDPTQVLILEGYTDWCYVKSILIFVSIYLL